MQPLTKYIPRKQEAQLRALVSQPTRKTGVILVEGARQVGKTTLVEQVLRTHPAPSISANLEEKTLLRARIDRCREFAEFAQVLQDELGFTPARGTVLFLDEAQESKRLGGFVRFMKEKWPESTIILTGSSLSRLFGPEVRYPVGRVTRLWVRPFSFSEFLVATEDYHLANAIAEQPEAISGERHETLLTKLDQYIQVGGLPQVVLDFAAGSDYRRRQAQILADYEHDFARLFSEEEQTVAISCFRSVANFVGSPSKNSSVIPSPTARTNEQIKAVFSRLERWGLILRSHQQGPLPQSSHKYLPKRYLFDTGLLRHLRELAVPSIGLLRTLNADHRRPLGGILENQVAIELFDQDAKLSGWKRSSSGLEIDFIVRQEDSAVPIECKAALTLKKTHLKGIFSYLEQYELNRGVVISCSPFRITGDPKKRHVLEMPLYLAENWKALIGRR